MISLIVCSRNSDISIELKENIQNTIGVEYELIVIDNLSNKHSIFSAYNEGVLLAKYPYLCFMHDDILYDTEGWGNRIIEHFECQSVGLIGVVGGHFMPKTPSSWNTTNVCSFNILQRIYKGEEYNVEHWKKSNYMNNLQSNDAVVVDGVWFCMKKTLFSIVSFDVNRFDGFHCYDLDICLQVRKCGFSIKVVSDILLEHFSLGSLNDDWIKNSHILYKKWKDNLPQIAGVSLSDDEIRERTELSAQIFELKEEITKIRNSKALRIGKFILNPIKYLKNKLQKVDLCLKSPL